MTAELKPRLRERYSMYVADSDRSHMTSMDYQDWLESVAYDAIHNRIDNEQSIGMYAAGLAAEMTRAFEGRLIDKQEAEDIPAWISRQIWHENASYRRQESEIMGQKRLVQALLKLIRYSVGQIKRINDVEMTHSERRGVVKFIAQELETRSWGMEEPLVDDIPF